MRCCENCGASEKEVMLEKVSTLNSELIYVDSILWCINCIYKSKKHAVVYGTAGEMSQEEIQMIELQFKSIEILEKDFDEPLFPKGFRKTLLDDLKIRLKTW